jgi:hypothetical protein
MDNAIETFQSGGIDFTGVGVPPDFVRAGCVPDQANDFVTTFDQVAGHS